MQKKGKEKAIGVLGWLCQMVLLAGLVSGILFFAAQELALPFRPEVLWAAVAVFAVLSVLLWHLPVAAGWLALGGTLVLGVGLFVFWDSFSLGARQAADSWIQLFNAYFNQWKAGPDMPELEGLFQVQKEALLQESSQIFLILLAGILLFGSGFFLVRLSSLAFPHVLMGLEMFGILSLGVVPQGYAVVWYLAAVFLWWSAGGSLGLRSTGRVCRWNFRPVSLAALFCSGAMLGIALLLSSTFLLPRTQGILDNGAVGMKTWIRARLEEAADWDALLGDSTRAGGVNGGNLDNQGNRADAGVVALRVTVSELPETPLYLKAYVGSEYTGDAWEALPDSLLERETGLTPEVVWQFPSDWLARSGARLQTMSVRLYDAASQYLYIPYGAALPEDARMVSDQYLRRWASQEDSFRFYADWQTASARLDAGERTPEEEEYEAFARQHYLGTPEGEVWEDWRSQQPENYDLDQLTRQIQAYLEETADYTLTPGSLPDGRDFVEYFLFENRQGYCTHFASAATLLFRLWDVPARYVEGYVVFPENFQDNGDGTWTAWVTDRNAHAWTEVYREGQTWCPVEATPPYFSGSAVSLQEGPSGTETPAEEPDTPEETQPAETESAPEETAEESEAAPEESQAETAGNPEGSGAAPVGSGWIRLALGVLVLLALAAALVWYKRRRRERRRSRILNPDRRAALLALGEEAERILSTRSAPCFLLDPAFGERAERQVEGLSRQELEAFAALVQRAWFSPHPVSQEEYRRCRVIYGKIRDHRVPALTGWARFWREIP